MTLIKNLTFILVVATMIIPQLGHAAATKCVNLNTSTPCSDGTTGQFAIDWKLACDGITSAPMAAIGVCASEKQLDSGTTADKIFTSSTAAGNINCWCKIISPAVSKWVFAIAAPTAMLCAQYCTSMCIDGIKKEPTGIRAALFSSFSE